LIRNDENDVIVKTESLEENNMVLNESNLILFNKFENDSCENLNEIISNVYSDTSFNTQKFCSCRLTESKRLIKKY
jgi:hypothetical protein